MCNISGYHVSSEILIANKGVAIFSGASCTLFLGRHFRLLAKHQPPE